MPCDRNVYKMEATKVAKYVGLRGQLQKTWGYNCITIPIIVGGLGAVTTNIEDYLALIPGLAKLAMCQKVALLG